MESQNRGFVPAQGAAGRRFPTGEAEQGTESHSVNRPSPGPRGREVQVTGTAEVCCPADRVSVRVSVGSSKESVSEATTSVSRRLDYILHSIRQHGVCEKDTTVRKFLRREEDLYHLDAEVIVAFSDFKKMEEVSSVLLEKLDKTVCVGLPQFYHSAECLDQLRKKVCVSAVENAQQKAREISQLLGQCLGHPLMVREEEKREWKSEDEESEGRGPGAAPTVTVFSRMSVSFSLRDKGRRKH